MAFQDYEPELTSRNVIFSVRRQVSYIHNEVVQISGRRHGIDYLFLESIGDYNSF